MSAREPGVSLSYEAFISIRGLVRGFAGIQLSDDTRSAIERRLGERVRTLGLASFEEYARYLAQNVRGAGELELAVELIATNETYFFREMPQLRAFEHELLPELRKVVEVRRNLSLWSAGCSSGEEVYTLAILLISSGLFDGVTLRVLGSDISRRVLTSARKGVYRDSSFRAMPSQYSRYFTRDAEGMVVSPQVRALCHFAHFNLLDESRAVLFGRMDAIFCRNVLIYLDADARQRLVRMFFERLHPGGYLMLGHSESLLHMQTEFETVQLEGSLAYRKPMAGDMSEVRR